MLLLPHCIETIAVSGLSVEPPQLNRTIQDLKAQGLQCVTVPEPLPLLCIDVQRDFLPLPPNQVNT